MQALFTADSALAGGPNTLPSEDYGSFYAAGALGPLPGKRSFPTGWTGSSAANGTPITKSPQQLV
jgi:hypothetical protein